MAAVLLWGTVSCDKQRASKQIKSQEETLNHEDDGDLLTLIVPLISTWKNCKENPTSSPVRLLWPPDGMSRAEQPLDLTWKPVSRNVQYQIQVAGDARFSSPTIDVTTEKTGLYLKGTGGPLFWRVRVKTEGAEGPWSEVRSFSFGPPKARPGEEK